MFIPRLISSIIILVIFFSIIILKGIIGLAVFTAVGVFLSIVTARELSDMLCNFNLSKFKHMSEVAAGVVFLIVLVGNFYNPDFPYWILISVLMILFCWIKILVSINKTEEFTKVINFIAVFILLIVPINFITLIFTVGYGATNIGVYLILFLVLVTKCGDMGAYVTGTLCSKRKGGNHKIVPSISPKKSWEGTIGGLVLSIIVSCVISHIYGINIGVAIVLGVVLFVGGFLGDLAESSLKRLSGVKDSGAVIPGIGGSLDLVDSLLLNAPLFYLMLLIFRIID
ncbi:MAG: phosphatidate cytidylyltransferase [Lentisphaerota bacterium]